MKYQLPEMQRRESLGFNVCMNCGLRQRRNVAQRAIPPQVELFMSRTNVLIKSMPQLCLYPRFYVGNQQVIVRTLLLGS